MLAVDMLPFQYVLVIFGGNIIAARMKLCRAYDNRTIVFFKQYNNTMK